MTRRAPKIVSEAGDGWTLYRGDWADVAKAGSLDYVAHVITDPPYEEAAHTKARRSLKDATQRKGTSNVGAVRRIDEALEIAFPPITAAELRASALAAASWASSATPNTSSSPSSAFAPRSAGPNRCA